MAYPPTRRPTSMEIPISRKSNTFCPKVNPLSLVFSKPRKRLLAIIEAAHIKINKRFFSINILM